MFHCLNAKTGKVNWAYDMLAAAWGSPLIVDGKVYIGDEDGDVVTNDFTLQPPDGVDQHGDHLAVVTQEFELHLRHRALHLQ